MLKAVIFDFDGVITDSEMLHLKAFNEALDSYGINITKEDYYNEYLGLTDRDLLKTLNEKGILKIQANQLGKILQQKKLIFAKLAQSESKIIGGVEEFLQMLEENKIPMAICSGALLGEIELILNQTGLRKYFEIIVSAQDVKKGKPDPEGFVLTLKKLKENNPEILPQDCIVIEDSRWGLEAAKAAGMKTVAVTNSYDEKELSTADKITDNLSKLTLSELKKISS
jgi:beta-phosphoglucomutase